MYTIVYCLYVYVCVYDWKLTFFCFQQKVSIVRQQISKVGATGNDAKGKGILSDVCMHDWIKGENRIAKWGLHKDYIGRFIILDPLFSMQTRARTQCKSTGISIHAYVQV